MYSEGVAKKRITMNRLVEVLSYQPARIFGLEEKGSLMPGKDADFVLLDPRVKGSVEASKHHSRCDYSPYEGWPLEGKIHLTVSRGKVVARDGEFLGQKGNGRFLPRKRPK
jgi:dihydropyrimidinase